MSNEPPFLPGHPIPSPYAPPTLAGAPEWDYYDPAGTLLAPARRAGVILWVVGGAIAAYATCNAAVGLAMPPDVLAERMASMNVPGPGGGPPLSAATMRAAMVVVSGLMMLAGVLLVGLGAFVRKGKRPAIVLSLVLAGLGLLLMLLVAAAGVAFAAAGAGLQGGSLLCVAVVGIGTCALLAAHLVPAARAGPRLRELQQQYQWQYWYSQQQQQAYAAGYGQQAAPPAPPNPQPSQSQPAAGGNNAAVIATLSPQSAPSGYGAPAVPPPPPAPDRGGPDGPAPQG